MTKTIKTALSCSLIAATPSFAAFSLSFSNLDFTSTPVFSNVTTFSLNVQSSETLTAGSLYSDPVITDIQYSVRAVSYTHLTLPTNREV